MERAFLEGLGLEAEAVDAVLAAHEKTLAGVNLQHRVAMAIGAAGGRNQKAIAALLDMEDLSRSEDPKAVENAVAALKKENGYLFESPTPPPYAKATGQADPGAGSEPTTLAGALRARMRK